MIHHSNGIIKYKPEDFTVTEKIILEDCLKKGNTAVFLLKKKNCSLFNALFKLSKILKTPINKFQFFGEKDKLAQTKQIISVSNTYKQYPSIIKNQNIELIHLFNIDETKKISMIGNKFFIIVRKIKDPNRLKQRIELLQKIGIPNYYDIQRFGKRLINHIIGYYLQNSKYYQATYFLLAFPGSNENPKIQKIRMALKNLFTDNTFNLEEAKKIKIPNTMDIEKLFLKILMQKLSIEKSWKTFPKKFSSLLKESYQSFLFNEKLKNSIKEKTENLITIKYDISKDILKFVSDSKVEINIANKKNLGIFEFVYPLEKIELTSLKDHYRDYFIKPIIKNYFFEEDEIFEGYKKLSIEFFLGKGSFATNVLNFILN